MIELVGDEIRHHGVCVGKFTGTAADRLAFQDQLNGIDWDWDCEDSHAEGYDEGYSDGYKYGEEYGREKGYRECMEETGCKPRQHEYD